MKKSPGKSRKEAVYSFFEGWSTMDINTTPPILPIFFHVCCRWKILTVYHVIMFLLLKLVDTWTFQERKMVTKTCASLKKNEVCDFFYNQSLEKLPKHFIHLRIKCIFKKYVFQLFQNLMTAFFNWAHGFVTILHSWKVPVSTGFNNRNTNTHDKLW